MTHGADPARIEALARHVTESIVALRPEEGAADLEELLEALPDHPQVHQLAACAVVIGFKWPLARGPYVPRPTAAPSPEELDLVFFHADRQDAASGFHKPIDYIAVLALSLESAALTAPRARRILLTDEATAVPATLPAHEVRRLRPGSGASHVRAHARPGSVPRRSPGRQVQHPHGFGHRREQGAILRVR